MLYRHCQLFPHFSWSTLFRSFAKNLQTSSIILQSPSIQKENVVEDVESGLPTDDEKVPLASNGKAFNMKMVSWNVNGVRNVLRLNAFDYFRQEACDLLCLQEVKCSDATFSQELLDWDEFPYKYMTLSKKHAAYAGVSVFAKEKPIQVEYGLGNDHHDDEGRVLTAHFDKFILVNVYVPNSGVKLKRIEYRMKWDKDFLQYLIALDSLKPVVVCGDLNVAHQEIDLQRPKFNHKSAGFTPQERANFGRWLESGFVDSYRHVYPNRLKPYTFWSAASRARLRNIGWRLDYFVVSQRLADSICDQRIRQHVMGSDHCPVVLYLAL